LPQDPKEFENQCFWDNFFKIRDGKAFEWYCGTNEIVNFLIKKGCCSSSWILTVGCGNSLLPFELNDNYGFSISMNVDFSLTAIKEMHQKNRNSNSRPGISFCAMDVLHMGLRSNFADFVIDKGLLDAMFSEDSVHSRKRAVCMASELCRVVKEDGLLLIVSLCQGHSIRILEACLPVFSSNCLEAKVQPLTPQNSKSALRPFCISLLKGDAASHHENLKVTFLNENGEQIKSCHSFLEMECLFVQFQKTFLEEFQQKESKRLLLTLDLKPWDADVDLEITQNNVLTLNLENVLWLAQESQTIPIGFGIKKLQMQCLVPDDFDPMEVCDLLCEHLEESIQSVDIVSTVRANIS